MAEQQSFQSYIDQSGYSPSAPVNKLAGSGSAVETISSLAVPGLKAYAEYDKSAKMAELDAKVQGLNEEYFNRDPSSIAYAEENYGKALGEVEEQDKEVRARLLTQNPTFQTGEEVEEAYNAPSQDPNAIKLREKLAQLKLAKEQGAMSGTEYESRALAYTRSLVSTNPHLSQELLSQLGQSLKLSGIQERIKADQDRQESAQKLVASEQTHALDLAKQFKVDITKYRVGAGVYNTLGILQEVGRIQSDKQVLDVLTDASQMDKFRSDAGIKEVKEKKLHIQAGTALLRDFSTNLAVAIGQASDPVEQAKIINDFKNRFLVTSMGSLTEYSNNDPELKEYANSVVKSIEDMTKSTLDITTGKARSEYLNNIASSLDSQGQIEFNRTYGSRQSVDLTLKLADSNLSWVLGDKGLKTKIDGFLTNLSKDKKGVLTDSDLSGKGPKGESVVDIVDYVAHNSVKGKEAAPEDVEAFNLQVGTVYDAVLTASNLTDKFKNSQRIIDRLNNPAAAESIKRLSPENRDKLTQVFKEHNTAIFNNIVRANDVGNIDFIFNEDGTIRSAPADATKGIIEPSPAFKANVLGSMNASLKAYAAMQGKTTKEVAEEFYTSQFGGLFNDEKIPKVDYKRQADDMVTGIFLKSPITDVKPEGTFGKYNISMNSARNPGPGLKPLDMTLEGPAYEKAQKEHATQMTNRLLHYYKGDEAKVGTAYLLGYTKVDALVKKYGETWFEQAASNNEIPPKTLQYLTEKNPSAFMSDDRVDAWISESATYINTLEKKHPEDFKSMISGRNDRIKWIVSDVEKKYNLPKGSISNEKAQLIYEKIASPEKAAAKAAAYKDLNPGAQSAGNPLTNLIVKEGFRQFNETGSVDVLSPIKKVVSKVPDAKPVPPSKDSIEYGKALNQLFWSLKKKDKAEAASKQTSKASPESKAKAPNKEEIGISGKDMDKARNIAARYASLKENYNTNLKKLKTKEEKDALKEDYAFDIERLATELKQTDIKLELPESFAMGEQEYAKFKKNGGK